MPYQRICVEDKQRLVDAHERGEDYVALARQLNIKRTTAYAIIRRTEANGGRVALPRGGVRARRQRVTPQLIEAAINIVEEHPDYTLDQVNAELRRTLPNHQHICRSTLCTLLNGQLMVMKKLEDAPLQRNTVAVKEARLAFAQWIIQLPINTEIIFIDEAGLNLWMKRTRGRARRGERAVRVVGGARGNNFTMTFAASPATGLIHHDLQQGGMNQQRFHRFLQAVAERLPADGRPRVMVFDNAPAHRQADNVEFPPDKNITVRWLPPYSPMLNIIESCFAQWKAAVKRDLAEVRDEMNLQPPGERAATLCQLAMQNTAVITPDNTAAYFHLLQGHLNACHQMQDIIM